jgi:hypothetical protein
MMQSCAGLWNKNLRALRGALQKLHGLSDSVISSAATAVPLEVVVFLILGSRILMDRRLRASLVLILP